MRRTPAHRTPRALLAASLAALLAACGPSATVRVQVSPDTVTVLLGGAAEATVTLARSGGATADVALTATGAPDWVTVRFSPATLSGAALESTMTIAADGADPDAEATTFQLSVSAVGPGLSAQDTITVEVERFDVAGTVIDAAGAPLPGATVLLAGRPAVVSGPDGGFEFSGVAAPYDLTVADTVTGVAHTFVGLTTPEPRVQPISALIAASATDASASISGVLSHATLVPVPAEHRVEVCVEGVDRAVMGCDALIEGESAYDIAEAGWWGAATASVRVRAVLYQVDADGDPVLIKAQAVSAVTELTDAAAEVVDLTLTATGSQASVTLTAVPPSGFGLNGHGLVSHYTATASFGLRGSGATPTTFPVIAPFFGGATHTAFATALSNAPGSSSQSVAWSVGHASGEAVTLAMPTPPTLVSPADTATDVSVETDFTFVNPTGGAATLLVQPAGSGPTYAVTTMATTARVPDLGSIGLALPSGAAYTWAVLASHHVTTADEAVSGDGYLGGFIRLSNALQGTGPGPASDGRVSTTDLRDLTTR